MNVKNIKITAICAGILIASFCVTGIIGSAAARGGEEGAEQAVLETGSFYAKDTEKHKAEKKYTVGTEDGFVVVLPEDGGEAVLRTEIRISGLREVDREMIKKGITVNSYEEVLKLLEDLNS